MKSIVLFGSGNVATHLFRAFGEVENLKIIQIYNHNPEGLNYFNDYCDTTTSLKKIKHADIYLIAVKDEAIAGIAESLNFKNSLILHTSGAVSLNVFKEFYNAGVFYPLQTFSKDRTLNFREIPICIEATNEVSLELLKELAQSVSGNILCINSEQRSSLHLAAVFVNNFVNYLYSEGENICVKNNLPFNVLHPLILETALKATNIGPYKAQTGPAKRNDKTVIQSHLSKLDPEQQKIYIPLTKAIFKLHGKKL